MLNRSLLLQFVGIHVPNFSCVGTPAQLRSFLGLVRRGVITPQHKARICFDLDRLLRITHSGSGAETTVLAGPMESNMRLLQVYYVRKRSERVFYKEVAIEAKSSRVADPAEELVVLIDTSW